MVSKRNSGQPYTNEIFTELKVRLDTYNYHANALLHSTFLTTTFTCQKGTREFEEYTEKFRALTETKQYTQQEISLMTEPMREELFKRVNEMVHTRLSQILLRLHTHGPV